MYKCIKRLINLHVEGVTIKQRGVYIINAKLKSYSRPYKMPYCISFMNTCKTVKNKGSNTNALKKPHTLLKTAHTQLVYKNAIILFYDLWFGNVNRTHRKGQNLSFVFVLFFNSNLDCFSRDKAHYV